jgi:hypothetical protein
MKEDSVKLLSFRLGYPQSSVPFYKLFSPSALLQRKDICLQNFGSTLAYKFN